jgi:tRNA G18 (ribose-2'-O)-methylase SpoU
MSTAGAKGFLIGALTVSSLWAMHHFWQFKRKRKPHAPASRIANSDNSQHQQQQLLLDATDLDLRLLRKAEAVIQSRATGITVVVERCTNDWNYSAILRTVEALGILNVWIIDPPLSELVPTENNNDTNNTDNTATHAHNKHATPQEMENRRAHHLFAQNAQNWLVIRNFATTQDCIGALKESNHTIWATDLSQEAVPLTRECLADFNVFPNKLALVFGTEAVGVSQSILDAADLRVYLPLVGFADSLNLSVATALAVYAVLMFEPRYRGHSTNDERQQLRQAWYTKLAEQRLLTPKQKRLRRKLKAMLDNCDRIQAKVEGGHAIHMEQQKKLDERDNLKQQLVVLENELSCAQGTVQEWIQNPPEPLTDLRRADPHRITFAGKGTKALHKEHWKDMAHTRYYEPVANGTNMLFRDRIKLV